MTPDQRRTYNAVYPRLIELSEKHDLGKLTDEESLEHQKLAEELETLMSALAPYPPTNQN